MAERTPSDEQAAFGVFPQLKRNRSKQDREAAKNVPVDLARGAVAGVLGAPGDIESLIRMLPYIDEKTILPTSEDIEKKLPFRSDTPVSRAATGLGTLGGGFYYGPGSPLKVVGALPSAIKHGAEEFAKASVAGAPHVIKPKGGNWLSGQDRLTVPENDLRRLKTRGNTTPEEIAGMEAHLAKIRPDYDLSNPAHVRELAEMERTIQTLKGNRAVDSWIDSNLKNYVKKEMGTPDDPVRRLAEEGIVHSPLRDDAGAGDYLRAQRVAEGFPAEGMGKSELARRWEDLADDSIRVTKAGAIQDQVNTGAKLEKARSELEAHKKKIDQDFLARMSDHMGNSVFSPKEAEMLLNMPFVQKAEILGDTKYKDLQGNVNEMLARESGFEKAAGDLNPFVAKLDPETRLYSGSTYDLGFDHIIDVLRQDVEAGRIRPEQMNKVSMEQAVRRVHEYDQEMAKRMAEAQVKATEGMPVHKEYPEGYRWLELTTPQVATELPSTHVVEPYQSKGVLGQLYRVINPTTGMRGEGYVTPERAIKEFNKSQAEEKLADALKYEGETMGHCVGGYCPDVVAGKSRIYSLRDTKGEPHVTVEVQPNQHLDYNSWFSKQPEEIQNKIAQRRLEDKNHDIYEGPEYLAAREALTPRIVQIKGKQNRAPKEDYLPFVQDFVRGGSWSDVRDLANTGLRPISSVPERARFESAGMKLPNYVTDADHEALINEYLKLTSHPTDMDFLHKTYGFPKPDVPPTEGMKRGGKVSISNNPDTMMMAVNDKRMKEGGAEDDTKPYFGGAGTKKYAAAKKRAEDADVNTLKDPKTYAAVAGLMGEAPDQMGFSVLHPEYENIRKVAEPAYGLGIAAQVAPIVGPLTKGLPVGASIKSVSPLESSGVFTSAMAKADAERALPYVLPRAMPKPLSEINAHAERVARQMMGEHVTSGKPKDTKNLAGRSMKESQRVKNLEYELVPTKDVPESQVYQPQIGDINVALPGDFTVSDVELKSLQGVPIGSHQQGGSRYGLGHMEAETPLFYASNEVPAQGVQNKVTDLSDLFGAERIMGHHMAMGPVATNFAQHFADANMRYIDYSKLKPSDMYEFDRVMSGGFVKTKKDKKTGETIRTVVDFPDWPGIADPHAALAAMEQNPEMRKFYNRLMQTPKITQPLGLPSGLDVRYAITSPDLRDMEVNLTGHGVGRMVPGAPLTDTAQHRTYSKGIPGMYEGHQEVLTPFAISFPDAAQHIIRKYSPKDFTGTIQKVFPHQRVDQQFMDEMGAYRKRIKELTGKKAGGAVDKPAGGAKQPAAYIDGSEFVEAAKKYGIKDSMNNLNKIVDLVNKGLTVDDAARQVADSGMHKAAGGAISGDDLIIEERPL